MGGKNPNHNILAQMIPKNILVVLTQLWFRYFYM